MHGTQLQERKEVPRTSALRRDVPRQAVPHPSQRVRHPSNGTRQAASDPVDGGGSRLGAAVHRRDQGRTRSSAAAEPHDAGRQRAAATCPRSSTPTWSAASSRRACAASRRSAAASACSKNTSENCRWRRSKDPDEINQFKTDSDYAEDVEIATMHRVLETLRAAMNWGMAQTPPLFNRSPFHRFGVRLNKKAETARDRRLTRDEEKRLLDTALQKMNTPEHQIRRRAPARPHHRRAGTLLPARRDADDSEQARELGHLPDRHPRRDGEGQGEPPHSVQPEGAAGGDPRSGARHSDPTRSCSAAPTAAYQPNIQTAWETLRLLANGIEPKPGREGAQWNREQLERIDLRWHDLRHEGACRLLADGVDIRIIQLMLGHASIQQTQRYLNVTDEELQERIGGELEEQRPTASPGVGKLIGLVSLPDCPRFVPGNIEILVAGAGFEPATFGL